VTTLFKNKFAGKCSNVTFLSCLFDTPLSRKSRCPISMSKEERCAKHSPAFGRSRTPLTVFEPGCPAQPHQPFARESSLYPAICPQIQALGGSAASALGVVRPDYWCDARPSSWVLDSSLAGAWRLNSSAADRERVVSGVFRLPTTMTMWMPPVALRGSGDARHPDLH